MDAKTQALLVLAAIGIIAGFLASILVGGGGLVQYLLSGVIGAFVGSYLLNALGVNLGIKNELAAQIVTATIGAIVVVLLARLIS
ncbi:MAG: GlsB/YeaQ/YmgE family stress response membrane protein [Hyphomicrobium sp.]|nr:GlsB/YeaQ/YmgE family stress response membrane protein [Hyphomicrobium sp.]